MQYIQITGEASISRRCLSTEQVDYLTVFFNETQQDIYNPTTRIFNDCVNVGLGIPVSDDEALISTGIYIAVIESDERGRGKGTAALEYLCDLADKYGLYLFCDAETTDSGCPKDNLTLLRWYEQYGFTHYECSNIYTLVREPQ